MSAKGFERKSMCPEHLHPIEVLPSKGNCFEGEKEMCEAMFYQFFSFWTIFFDGSDVQVSWMSIFDSCLKTFIEKDDHFTSSTFFGPSAFLLNTVHGQGQWEDNAEIVMSDHKVGHRQGGT